MSEWIDPLSAARRMDRRDVSELCIRVPPVSDRLLVELVNGLDVSVDVLAYRPRGGLVASMLDVVTGSEARRRTLLDQNLVAGQAALSNWVLELTDNQRITAHMLAITAERLRLMRDTVERQQELLRAHGAAIETIVRALEALAHECDRRLAAIEQRLHAVELRVAAADEIDTALSDWTAGSTYRNVDPLLGAILLARQVVAGANSRYELATGRTEPRDRLVRGLIHGLRGVKAGSLASVLDETAANSDAFDAAIAAESLSFAFGSSLPAERAPYVFAVATTMELASLPRSARPASPGASATALIRRRLGHFDATCTLWFLVERVVAELADLARSTLETATSRPAPATPRTLPVQSRPMQLALRKSLGPTSGQVQLSSRHPDDRGPDDERVVLGLALCGGGARGAFQLGVLEYLSDVGFLPDVIAGTSIGALNASVVAASETMHTGVASLLDLWSRLGDAVGPDWHDLARSLDDTRALQPAVLRELTTGLVSPFLDPAIVESLVAGAVDVNRLRTGPDLWVTAFPLPTGAPPGIPWMLDVAETWLQEGAEWFHLQDHVDDGLAHALILASAAIPVLTPARRIRGRPYVDGGTRPRDNTPIQPLVSKCTHVVVVHLNNGRLWNRHEHGDPTIIEVRPKEDIHQSGTRRLGHLEALLDFSRERSDELRARGYSDAKAVFEPITETLAAVTGNRAAMAHAIQIVNVQ